MSSQIFKYKLPNELLFDLLDVMCIKNNNKYIIDYNSYKKGLFNDFIINFIEKCKDYYYLSKTKKYLDRKLTYQGFLTIIRQICKFNNVSYTSEIKYERSDYGIFYYINFTS